jgi:hypothetical protein
MGRVLALAGDALDAGDTGGRAEAFSGAHQPASPSVPTRSRDGRKLIKATQAPLRGANIELHPIVPLDEVGGATIGAHNGDGSRLIRLCISVIHAAPPHMNRMNMGYSWEGAAFKQG